MQELKVEASGRITDKEGKEVKAVVRGVPQLTDSISELYGPHYINSKFPDANAFSISSNSVVHSVPGGYDVFSPARGGFVRMPGPRAEEYRAVQFFRREG